MINLKNQSKNGLNSKLDDVLVKHSLNWNLEISLFVLILVTSILFWVFPDIDIWFSNFFFSEDDKFWAKEVEILNTVRSIGPFLVRMVVLASIFYIVLRLLDLPRLKVSSLQSPLFLLTTLLVGPGIVISMILKDNWGRPRPWMTESFGGKFPNIPVWEISDFCERNCSFVSGEAAIGIWLMSVAFIVPLVWRRTIVLATLLLALIFSLNRIAFGGHFLSDTILSWEITLLVLRLGYRLMFNLIPKFMTSERIERLHKKLGIGTLN